MTNGPMPSHSAIAVAKLLDLAAREIWARQVGGGLAPGQWAILRYLSKTERMSRSTPEVAAYLGADIYTVARALSALVRKGLIDDVGVAGPYRSSRYILSNRGLGLVANDPVVRLAAAIERIPADDREVVARCLNLVIADLAGH